MKISFDLDASIAGIAEDEIRSAERAVTGGVRDVGSMIKTSWRQQVVGSGLGQRLANTIRQSDYPARGESIGAASLVYARPNRKKSASAADVIDAFDKGALIRGKDRIWLAIPLPAAGPVAATFRRGRLTPYLWEQRTGIPLRFVYRRGRPSLLVADDARVSTTGQARKKGGRRRKDGMLTGAQTVPVFLLLPQVKLRKRLNLGESARAANARLAQAILARWK